MVIAPAVSVRTAIARNLLNLCNGEVVDGKERMATESDNRRGDGRISAGRSGKRRDSSEQRFL